MSLPWKLHRWHSSLAAEECAARLVDAAGATFVRPRGVTVHVTVSITGRTLVVSAKRAPTALPGAPHFHGMFVRSPAGAHIVGRFSPGAVLQATATMAIVLSAILAASIGSNGAPFWRAALDTARTPAAVVACVVVSAMCAVTLVRIFSWQRDCADIEAILMQCCEATRSETAVDV